MKRTILTLSLALFIFTFLLSQTTKEAVRQAKLELYDCTSEIQDKGLLNQTSPSDQLPTDLNQLASYLGKMNFCLCQNNW